MIIKDFAQSFFNDKEMRKPLITGCRFAKGICAAAAIGFMTGVLITHRSRKKKREDQKSNTVHTTVTIDVRDLENIKIERIE